ncbi:MAG: BatD family protein [Flavobacteriaceae bacterium]
MKTNTNIFGFAFPFSGLGVRLFFLLFSQIIFAQVEFTAKLSRSKIGVNENVRVEFIMNVDGDHLQLPDFEGFRVVSGPFQQISHSNINGKRSLSKSFGYTIQPTRQGTLTIGSATITFKGQKYQTEPVQLTVTAPVERPNDPSEPLINVDESIHLVAQLSKRNPYLNEPVSVVYKLYFKDGLGIRNFNLIANPEYNDFWSHNIEVKQYEAQNETFNGEKYSSIIIKKVLLYPQKSGKLTIEPLDLELALQVPTNRRNMFGRVYHNTSTKLSTGVQSVDVRPLPENGRPDDFSGAVGTFDLIVKTDKTAVRQGEAIEMEVAVSGKGNLELFSLPKPVFPSSLEVYDPIPKKQITVGLSGMNGKVSEKYTIIPQYQGKYIIKPIHFSYFDLETRAYKTLTSKEITIDMIDGPVGNQTAQNDDIAKNEVTPQNHFKFIELKTTLQPVVEQDFLFSTRFFVWLLLPLLLIPVLIFVKSKKDERDSDVVGNKIRSTNKLAKKYLSEARKNQNNKEKFYESLEKALHNFLKAKLKIETSEMSKEKISEVLSERKVDAVTIQDFISLLESAELVRYAPSLASSVGQDYEKAVKTIAGLEKQIR